MSELDIEPGLASRTTSSELPDQFVERESVFALHISQARSDNHEATVARKDSKLSRALGKQNSLHSINMLILSQIQQRIRGMI